MKKITTLSLVTVALIAGACASNPHQSDPKMRAKALEQMKKDFHPRGIAGLERLDEDGVQALCNQTADNPTHAQAEPLMKAMLATVKFPADGNLMGDWQRGEKIAQNGRGMSWNDDPKKANGGACYNCHQIGPDEDSFGSIGPSLYQFGKKRGNGPDIQKYVYSKIFNSKSFNICTAMPRFGYVGALEEAQIKDLVALLLDPASPVNSK